MINLNRLVCIEIEEYDTIISNKHSASRNRLREIRASVLENYDFYINQFNTIAGIEESEFDDEDSKKLIDCYKTQTIARDRLLKRIIDNQSEDFQFYCPYCLIANHTTFDHYIPEGAFPVFSVLARNLIPCCTTCNGKKLQYWRENGTRGIIHYYNDAIPNEQFLFGILRFNDEGRPSITFSLVNRGNIAAEVFQIIQRHYTRLNLLHRYAEKINRLISEIKHDVTDVRAEFGNQLTSDGISRIITRKSTRMKNNLGNNNWRSIALDLLANSEQFLNSLQ